MTSCQIICCLLWGCIIAQILIVMDHMKSCAFLDDEKRSGWGAVLKDHLIAPLAQGSRNILSYQSKGVVNVN